MKYPSEMIARLRQLLHEMENGDLETARRAALAMSSESFDMWRWAKKQEKELAAAAA